LPSTATKPPIPTDTPSPSATATETFHAPTVEEIAELLGLPEIDIYAWVDATNTAIKDTSTGLTVATLDLATNQWTAVPAAEFPMEVELSYRPVIPFDLSFDGGAIVPITDWSLHEQDILAFFKQIQMQTHTADGVEEASENSTILVAIILPYTAGMSYNYLTDNSLAYAAILPPGEVLLTSNGRIDCGRCMFVQLSQEELPQATFMKPVGIAMDLGTIEGGMAGNYIMSGYYPNIAGKGRLGHINSVDNRVDSTPYTITETKLILLAIRTSANADFLAAWRNPARKGQLVYPFPVVDVHLVFATGAND